MKQNSLFVCRGQFLTWISRRGELLALGVNLAPVGFFCPLEETFSLSFTTRGEHYLLFRRMEGQTENVAPKGITSLLGENFAKFALRGVVKNGPQTFTTSLYLDLNIFQ
jgi:hypothetical protein